MFNFDYTKVLYRRNNHGKPCFWFAEGYSRWSIKLTYGIVGHTPTIELVETNRKVADEVASRFNAKRKIGYKYLSELKDNCNLPVEGELLQYLEAYLPKYNTSADGNLLPMLAKVYDNENNKLFKKVSNYIGQWKINGLRCFISAKYNNGDLYRPIRLEFQSREGTIWNSLYNLEEYLLEVLNKQLLKDMLEDNYILDGELYLPGHSVNEINHFVKDPNCSENKLLQYWCYDIAVENMLQASRNDIRMAAMEHHIKIFKDIDEHLSNTERLICLPVAEINNDASAFSARNKFINLGFEGLILRNPNEEYQYGKRNLAMIKYKKSTDGKFKITNIISEGVKRPDVPLFILKNDLNNEKFEVHLGGSLDYQKLVFKNKDKYIGKFMYVEYGERSGIKNVPFHVKHTHIIDYDK